MYSKISKWLSYGLIAISVALIIWAFTGDLEANDGALVNVLLMWTYILFGVAVALVVLLGIAYNIVNNPQSLKKLGIGLVIAAVVCGIAYALASGAELQNYIGVQPSEGELKLTDTLLNITYILGIGAVLSILVGIVISSVRK